MRGIILAIPATLAAVVLIAASAAMNAEFWSGQGETERAAMILAAVSIATDIAKALLPIYIDRAIAARRFAFATVCSGAFVVFVAASLIAAVGFVAQNRSKVAGSTAAISAEHRLAKAELDDVDGKIALLPSYPPIAQLRADLESKKHHPRWRSSDGCSNATAMRSMAFCSDYKAAVGQLDAAVARARLEKRRDTLRDEVVRLTRAGATQDATPQVTMLAKLASLFTPLGSASNVEFWLVLFTAILVEAGAAFMLYAAVAFPGVARAAHSRKSNATARQSTPPAPPKYHATQVAHHFADHPTLPTESTATQVARQLSDEVGAADKHAATEVAELPPARRRRPAPQRRWPAEPRRLTHDDVEDLLELEPVLPIGAAR